MNKNTIISRFPLAYQIYYEYRTNKLVRKNRTDSIEVIEENLRHVYEERVGLPLNLDDPVGYTEKIQWRKLHGMKEIYSLLSDKYAVRQWVSDKIGEQYLIPLLGVWDAFDQIDFSLLPEKFVLKTNNASTTNLIVKDKEKLNLKLVKRKFDYWMKLEYWNAYGYEMQYKAITPKIVAEEYIEPLDGAADLRDYKFLCFDGKVEYIWVDLDRYHDHKRMIFDKSWKPAGFNQFYPLTDISVAPPKELGKMLQIAEKLAEGFDHVRVDLYCNAGSIYFGEMTFTNGSGFEPIIPEEWNWKLGEKWRLER